MEDGYAVGRFKKLSVDRSFYLDQAELSASLTIPSLYPPNRDESGRRQTPQDLPAPFQNFGAYCVESLSSKFLTSTFPANQQYFRYEISEKTLDEAREMGAEPEEIIQLKAEIAKALSFRERAVGKYFEQSNLRVVVSEAFRHLIVGGNVLLHIPTDGTGARLISLPRYVVRRGPMGRVLEICIKESFDFDGLPASVRELSPYAEDDMKDRHDSEVSVYTHLQLDVDKKQFSVKQEAFGVCIPGSEGTVPEDNCPYIPLRFTTVEGEHYGRGYVETYRGSLNSLEVLRRAILENSAAAARMLWLVRPNGSTKVRNLARSENGAFVSGDTNDVSVLRMDKTADLSVAQSSSEILVKELSFAFLLNSSIQRSGERVTSTEIKFMANQIEATQAGIFSTLARTMQLPIVKRIEAILTKSGEITSIPKNTVEPTVIGGLAAIGRDTDMNKLRELTADFANAASILPEVVQYLNASTVAEKIVLNHSIPAEGLLKTPAEVAQAAQQQQQQQLMQQAMVEGTKAVPDIARDAMGNQMQQEQGEE